MGTSSLPSFWLVLMTLGLVSFTSLLYISRHQDHNLNAQLRSSTVSSPTSSAQENIMLQLKDYVRELEDVVRNLNSSSITAAVTRKNGHHPNNNSMGIHPASISSQTITKDTKQDQPQERFMEGMYLLNDDNNTKEWLESLSRKLRCLRLHLGSVYLYHTRKAAGTTVRDILMQVASQQWKVPYYETEGIVLPAEVLALPGALTVTTLRDPVSRALSLYWYEHVGWFDGVLKQTSRCKSLRE